MSKYLLNRAQGLSLPVGTWSHIVASALTQRAGTGNALAVLNVPLLLIVQPRKRRKPSTTLLWNGRNCFCHGSAGIQERRNSILTPSCLRPASVSLSRGEKGSRLLFPPPEKPTIGLCLQRADSFGIKQRGWVTHLTVFIARTQFQPCKRSGNGNQMMRLKQTGASIWYSFQRERWS